MVPHLKIETISHWEIECKMSIFNLFSRKDINEGVVQYRKEDNAVLLDVRTDEEFSEGHIEGSLNLPIGEIDRATIVLPDKSAPIYVYCRSGNRSKQASEKLVALGYTNIVEFGGINDWPGETVSK